MADDPVTRFGGSRFGFKSLMEGFLAYMSGTTLSRRADIMAKAGTTFGGERKHYQIFGWPLSPDYNTYYHLYKRNGLAKRIIKAYPKATWRMGPAISDGVVSNVDSPFEKAWRELENRRKIFHYLERADRLAVLGRYSILFMGFNDGITGYEQLENPVGAMSGGGNPWDKLLYFQPYGEDKVKVLEWEEDYGNERFGMPRIYQISVSSPSMMGSVVFNRTVRVHWTRVLHLAEDTLESDLEGDPGLEAGLNLILDLEKTLGAAAEAFFQQWPPGMKITSQKDTTINIEDFQGAGEGKEVIEDFMHGVKRWLVMNGMDVEPIKPELGDPTRVVDPLLDLLAGATGIPKRILIGSERGELASTQDETNWNERIAERRNDYAEPTILRPLVQSLLDKGILPPPTNGEFQVEWPENVSLGEDKRAEIAERKSNALNRYVSVPGSNEVVPEDVFLSEVMGFSQEVVDKIQQARQEVWAKESREMLEDEEDEEPENPPSSSPQSTKEVTPKPTTRTDQ